MKTIVHKASGKLLGITKNELVHEEIELIVFNEFLHKKLKFKNTICEKDFPKTSGEKIEQYTIFDYVWDLSNYCGGFHSVDRKGEKLSKTELKRWFERGCIQINWFLCKDINEPMDFAVHNLVLFPSNDKKRCTMM
jgi:hypothetical protein